MRVKTQPESKNKNLVTAKEVADIMSISRSMVERLTLQKKLIPVSTPYSLYYYSKAAVLELKATLK